jgi:Na+-driven multidrug efflux pump
MSERRDLVLSAPIGRAIWALAWPMLLTNELDTCSFGIDLFWIGRLVGESGLVVESLYRPFALMIIWFFTSTTVGASVSVGRSVGATDGKGLSITAGAITLTMVLWLGLVALVVPFASQIAGVLVGQSAAQQPLTYFLLANVLFALPAGTVLGILLEVTNATGETRYNIARIAVDLVFAIVLAPILITAFGIVGAPLSTGVCCIGLLFVVWLMLYRNRFKFHLGELEPGAWRIRPGLWKELLRIGVPVQLGRVAMWAGQCVLVQLVARDSDASVAGYGIATGFVLFGAMATMAFADAGGIVISQSLGAGLDERAMRVVRATLLIGWSVAAVLIGLTFFALPAVRLFTSDQEVVTATLDALSRLRWGLFGAVTWQVLLACFAAYQTTVRAGILLVVGEAFGIALAFVWPGSHLDAVCTAFVASNLLKAVAMLWLFFSQHGSVRSRG